MGAQFPIGGVGVTADVAALPTGGYVASWIEDKNIYVQRLDPNGNLIGGPILVQQNYEYTTSLAQVVGLSEGRFCHMGGGH